MYNYTCTYSLHNTHYRQLQMVEDSKFRYVMDIIYTMPSMIITIITRAHMHAVVLVYIHVHMYLLFLPQMESDLVDSK